MSYLRTHFKDVDGDAACGRKAKRIRDNVNEVDCLNCKDSQEFIMARDDMLLRAEAAFQAQEPKTVVPQFGRVNADGVMECPECAGTLWREKPRSLFSYHYVCFGCGKSVHPMTETGMCT